MLPRRWKKTFAPETVNRRESQVSSPNGPFTGIGFSVLYLVVVDEVVYLLEHAIHIGRLFLSTAKEPVPERHLYTSIFTIPAPERSDSRKVETLVMMSSQKAGVFIMAFTIHSQITRQL